MSVDPVTASLVLSIAGAASGVISQSQQASAQKRANEQQRANAVKAAQTNYEASNTQLTQEGKAASEKARQAQIQGQQDAATAATAAGEAGVSGMSVQALLNELGGKTLENTTNIEANYLRQKDAAYYQRENITNSTQSTINTLPSVASPDYLGAALTIAKAGNQYRNDRTVTASKLGG